MQAASTHQRSVCMANLGGVVDTSSGIPPVASTSNTNKKELAKKQTGKKYYFNLRISPSIVGGSGGGSPATTSIGF